MDIKINNLSIVGIDSFANDTLANVKQLQLNVNLWSVIGDETYQIKSVNLDQPNTYAKVFKLKGELGYCKERQ